MTALTMARTKSHARARHAESAERSTAVNDGGGSRLGTTTVGDDGGNEVNVESSSERARRAARRGKAALQEKSAATSEETEAHARAEEAVGDDAETDSRDCHLTPAARGIVSENNYTALDDDAEDARTEDSD